MCRFIQKFILISGLALISPSRLWAVVDIQWTLVGNAGNPADTLVMSDGTSGYGSVGYVYRIGTFEVTNSQYAEFLNAKDSSGANSSHLYDSSTMVLTFSSGNPNGTKYAAPPGMANWPMTGASWYNAIRFSNWLNNGQGNGSTETGAYTLARGPDGTPLNGSAILRNAAAQVFLPSENEWYKVAYYNPATSSYFRYATSSDLPPVAEPPPGGTNSANWNFGVGYPTDVGSYRLAHSPYGTFDQSGNAYEWNEALIQNQFRGLRGGSYAFFPQATPNDQYAGYRNSYFANANVGNVGFRVAVFPNHQ